MKETAWNFSSFVVVYHSDDALEPECERFRDTAGTHTHTHTHTHIYIIEFLRSFCAGIAIWNLTMYDDDALISGRNIIIGHKKETE